MLVTRQHLRDMLALAEAAYDPSTLPVGYSAPVLITADVSLSCALFDRKQLDFGFSTRRDGMMYVCFRGTEDIEEWADDACAVLVAYKLSGAHSQGLQGYLRCAA